ncbi:MAG TPA: class I SAM-dependent methyltransferase [Nitrospirota bacterium]|nr:class I SAM-dependent methyltransferase [Nitrospirota bacterium]
MISSGKADGKTYDVCFCEKCAIASTSPMPSAAELSALYAAESYRTTSGTRFNKLLENLIFLFRLGRKRRIERYIRKGRILDIGCGRGLFLSLMRTGGWDVAGTEFDEETASYASRVYGLKVKSGGPSSWGFPDESFDVITIHHALEHIPDPAEMLGACGRLLKKGGLLVIAVPNISSLQAVAGKGVWFHLDVPYHLYHFSEAGLARLLTKHSFAVSGTRRFDLEQGVFGWLQTLMNLSGIRKNLFYDLLKDPVLRKRELQGTAKTEIVFTFLLLPLYVPLSFVLSLFESFLLKRGGTVEMYAVKKG